MRNTANRVKADLRQFGFSPFSFRLWHGMSLDAWLRVMRGKWHLVSVRRYPLVATITALAVFNQLLKWASLLIYGRRLSQVSIAPDPIFILGHWRSGTTWLHQIIAADPRLAAPTVQACFRPETFLVGRGWITPLFRLALTGKRPMDNVPLALESVEEDEHGINLSGGSDLIHNLMFPNNPHNLAYAPSDMSEGQAASWWTKWMAFLKRVQFINPGKRLVLKSPAHTMRIPDILERFPEAKFVHIVRDPYKLYQSTVRTIRAMHTVSALQDYLPSDAEVSERAIKRFCKLHRAYRRDHSLIPEGQLVTLRYEDLRADPIAELRRVYEVLHLEGFEEAAVEISKIIGTQKGYQNNQYALAPETEALVDRAFEDYFEVYGYLPMSQRFAKGK